MTKKNTLRSGKSNILALQEIKLKSVKTTGYFKFSYWKHRVPLAANFKIIKGQLSRIGEKKISASCDDYGKQSTYIGVLSDQFGIPELKTILYRFGKGSLNP